MSYIVASAEEIAKRLRPGQLIILESTTYPGTTDELVLPMLEKGGLKVGKDFFLAFSPERVDPSNRSFNTHNIPKVIGGMTEDCTALATALYDGAITTIVPVSSPRVAEMVKLLENTFRAVNIGMVNELALMCDRMGIDVWEVVKAAATKPFGFMAFYPGPGLGGHCIPVDPFYLSWKARESGFEARFIELAGAVNGNMPHYVVSLMSEALNSVRKPLNGSKVLVAGIAYKKDVDDIRESPALDLLHLLRERGAELSYTDPFVPKLAAKEWPERHRPGERGRHEGRAPRSSTASSSSPTTPSSTTTSCSAWPRWWWIRATRSSRPVPRWCDWAPRGATPFPSSPPRTDARPLAPAGDPPAGFPGPLAPPRSSVLLQSGGTLVATSASWVPARPCETLTFQRVSRAHARSVARRCRGNVSPAHGLRRSRVGLGRHERRQDTDADSGAEPAAAQRASCRARGPARRSAPCATPPRISASILGATVASSPARATAAG